MQIIDVPNCPIDGTPGIVLHAATHDAFFGTEGQWTYRQHTKTGHLWLDPRPADQCIGDLYDNYYTHTGKPAEVKNGLWEQAISLALSERLGYPMVGKPRLLAKLLSYMPSVGAAAELEVMRINASETGRLLDFGCGGGAFLRRMRNAGWTVAGTEPDTKAAARLAAEEGFPVYSSLDDLIQKRETGFDIIVLSHVIEHLPEPIKTLIQLRSLLNDGGKLLLTTPNALSLGSLIFGQSWRGLEPPRHFNVFTPNSLRQALERAGFNVGQIKTDVRLARGIWYLSYLARKGGCELEVKRKSERQFLKMVGYAFQLFEALAVKLRPTLGEEIFCVATIVNND